jgi:RNA polymerase sigma-70 factor (ECF subfamily)
LSTFAEPLLLCQASLHRYARALCPGAAEAEELVQEALRRALAAGRKRAPLDESGVRRWLFTITRNIWQNGLRQRRHDVRSDPAYGVLAGQPGETPEDRLLRRALQFEVREAVDALPVQFREVIVLRELEELSYAEIAVVLDCPAGTVMSRQARARALLRRALAATAPAGQEREA